MRACVRACIHCACPFLPVPACESVSVCLSVYLSVYLSVCLSIASCRCCLAFIICASPFAHAHAHAHMRCTSPFAHANALTDTHSLTHIHTYTHAHTITTTTTTTTTWVSLSVKEPYAQPHLGDLTWGLGLTTTTSAALQERTEFRGTPLRLKSDMIGRTDNDCLYLTAYQHITVHAAARTSLQLEGRDCGSLCLLIIGCRSTAQAFQ